MIPEGNQPLISKSAIAIVVAATLLCAHPAMAQNTVADGATVQAASDSKPGPLTVSGGIDSLNQYHFRGIRQHSTGLAIWPWADLAIAAYSGDDALKGININLGNWNSLHSGDTGFDGPSGKLWYESDFYASLGLAFGGGVSFTTTYTTYTSPNNSFSTVKGSDGQTRGG